jgi:hypothetical protein
MIVFFKKTIINFYSKQKNREGIKKTKQTIKNKPNKEREIKL